MEDDKQLAFGTKEEQHALLQKVLAASDIDADEEMVPGEGSSTSRGNMVTKRKGTMSSLSGGDDSVYLEYRAKRGKKHDLFTKFRQ